MRYGLYFKCTGNNDCCIVDTKENKISTITGYGIGKLINSLESGGYGWFAIKKSNYDELNEYYTLTHTVNTIEEIKMLFSEEFI